MEAVELIRKDHEEMRNLFEQYEKKKEANDSSRQELIAPILQNLTGHSKMEEEIFYPRVKEEMPKVKDEVQEGFEEHAIVDNLVEEIGTLEPGAESMDAKVKVLMDMVKHHMEEEENSLLKEAEKLPEEERNQLGTQMEALKKKEMAAMS